MGENERNWFKMQPNLMCGREMIDICEEIAKKGHGTLKNDFIQTAPILIETTSFVKTVILQKLQKIQYCKWCHSKAE